MNEMPEIPDEVSEIPEEVPEVLEVDVLEGGGQARAGPRCGLDVVDMNHGRRPRVTLVAM